jgi:hypothetical protein
MHFYPDFGAIFQQMTSRIGDCILLLNGGGDWYIFLLIFVTRPMEISVKSECARFNYF